MDKIRTIRINNLYLNVFRTPEGDLSLTIRRGYQRAKGYGFTNYLRPKDGDINTLIKALATYMVWEEKGAKPEEGSA